MKYVYGPVQSRRLGFSLGVSLVPYKICNFDCVYCQQGPTTVKIGQRKEYVKIKDIILEIKQFLDDFDFRNLHLDYITLSGTGEPLLNLKISDLIKQIKIITKIPIALITNASLFVDSKTREDILGVDLILPSLDAVDQDIFKLIDRPHEAINIDDIVVGLIALRKEFYGKIYLEIMLVKDMNDKIDNFIKFKKIIRKIRPNKVHLNVPKRHTSEIGILVPNSGILKKIKEALGKDCEII